MNDQIILDETLENEQKISEEIYPHDFHSKDNLGQEESTDDSNHPGGVDDYARFSNPSSEGASQKTPLGIPIKLEFLAGSHNIPLNELSELKPGYIFDLGAPINQVEIIANGAPVGHGELVEVGGRMGVRLLSFREE